MRIIFIFLLRDTCDKLLDSNLGRKVDLGLLGSLLGKPKFNQLRRQVHGEMSVTVRCEVVV